MHGQTHREIWDFPASEEGKKCLPYTATMEWLQIKKKNKLKWTSTMWHCTPGIKINKSHMSKVKSPANWLAKSIFQHNPK